MWPANNFYDFALTYQFQLFYTHGKSPHFISEKSDTKSYLLTNTKSSHSWIIIGIYWNTQPPIQMSLLQCNSQQHSLSFPLSRWVQKRLLTKVYLSSSFTKDVTMVPFTNEGTESQGDWRTCPGWRRSPLVSCIRYRFFSVKEKKSLILACRVSDPGVSNLTCQSTLAGLLLGSSTQQMWVIWFGWTEITWQIFFFHPHQ